MTILRFQALELFNSGAWYEAHDAFEELWHEQMDPERKLLQAIVQIAVAHVHLERGNRAAAPFFWVKALGRLQPSLPVALGLDLTALHTVVSNRLSALQSGEDPEVFPPPRLLPAN